uniref:Uncharacterized protein n=1 Tax=Cacopsylla melanoneura TaxID=428564 RepID=A0A8D9B077_9HEMI
MKTMSCFRCHREIEGKQGNSECTHNVLGQIKYPNSRNDYLQNPSFSEEISCEPVLYQFSPESSCSQEQAETQQDTLENIKHGDAMLIKFKCKNKEYRYACLVLSAENNEIQVQGLRS